MILGVTGHRPDRCGGSAGEVFVRREIRRHLHEQKPERVYLGMARGFDQWVAEACEEYGIPWVPEMAVGQFVRWSQEDRTTAMQLLLGKHCVRQWAEIYRGGAVAGGVTRPSWETDGPMLAESHHPFWGLLMERTALWREGLDFRNHAIVDRAGKMLCCWDGGMKGGTYNAIMYALRKAKVDVLLHDPPGTIRVHGFSWDNGTLIRIDPREAP